VGRRAGLTVSLVAGALALGGVVVASPADAGVKLVKTCRDQNKVVIANQAYGPWQFCYYTVACEGECVPVDPSMPVQQVLGDN
jgi:hypothetical protein